MSPPPAAGDSSSPLPTSSAMEVDTNTASSKVTSSSITVDSTPDSFTTTYNMLLGGELMLERSVLLKDARLTGRALRDIPRLRRSFHSFPSLSALFTVIRSFSLPSSPYSSSPPLLSARLIESQLIDKDEGAAKAWKEAQRRIDDMGQKTIEHRQPSGENKDVKDGMEVEETKEGGTGAAQSTPTGAEGEDSQPTPDRVGGVEVALWLDVLYGVYLLDGDYYEEAASLFSSLVRVLQSINRRSVDLLSSKVFYYYALSYEKWEEANKAGGLSESSSSSSSTPSPPLLSSILPVLLTCYRSACLQHNDAGQSVLINAILRVHLLHHDYQLADTFRLKSSYPTDLRLISSAVYARYCYYVGKIQCIQLAYSDAFTSLQQARRKAPQHSSLARDFKYQVNVLAILTQLLMGEIPERTTFNEGTTQTQQLATITALTRANSLIANKPSTTLTNNQTSAGAAAPAPTLTLPPTSSPSSPSSSSSSLSSSSSSSSLSLYPYLCLTRAVRVGDLSEFHAVTSRYSSLFARDDVSSLILRLRHNVIKAGLRKVNLAYSSIPMSAIASKLALEESFKADGEQVVVKAISDGVIEAKLDPVTSALHSAPSTPSYASSQPQHAFHRRIAFALDLYNESIKALTFPSSLSRPNVDPALDDDDDEEDSLAALQRKERRDKEKEQEKKDKEKEKEGKGKDKDKDKKTEDKSNK